MQSATIPLRGKRPTTVITSRGCPYKCSFCATQVVAEHRFRPRRVDNIIEELKMLQSKYGVDEIFVYVMCARAFYTDVASAVVSTPDVDTEPDSELQNEIDRLCEMREAMLQELN